MTKDNLLLEARSPWGNITAYVEGDGDTIYFSLIGPEGIVPLGETNDTWRPFRACWVCNTRPVDPSKPINMSEMIKEMEQGKNPIMPGQHCQNPTSPPQFDPEKFDIVWFEECDCAALLYEDEILTVIPAWCSPNFSNTLGYSREFKGTEFFGMKPLSEILPQISERIDLAKAFWEDWKEVEEWEALLERNIETLENVFGQHTKYFKIDGGQWPPKGLLLFEQEDKIIFISVGACILAQPRVELFQKNPELFRRFEWGMAISKDIVEQVSIETIGEYISKAVCIPWNQLGWLGEGQIINCDIFSKQPGCEQIESVVLIKDQLDAPQITLPIYRGDPVNLLWAVPITSQEHNFLTEHTNDQFFQMMREKNCTWTHQKRPCTV